MAENIDNPRDEELVAYLDGELDDQSAHALEQKMQADARMRHDAEAHRRVWELLDFLPQPEPSATFTSRTLEKLTVLRPNPSTLMPTVTPAPAALLPQPVVAAAARTRAWPSWVAVAVAAAVLFLLGYVLPGPGRRARTPTQEQREQEMARDLRAIDQLPLLQHGDDLAFLMLLDKPDLFGEDGH